MLEPVANRLELRVQILRQFHQRPEAPVPLPELQQRIVQHRDQAAAQHREHAQLIVRPLDRAQRRAQRAHFFALVKALRAHQQMRDPARLQAAHILLRQVGAHVREAPEQNADIAILPTARHSPVDRSRTFHPLSRTSHSMNAATAFGEHSRIFAFDKIARAVRLRHRQRHNPGLRRRRLHSALQRQVVLASAARTPH